MFGLFWKYYYDVTKYNVLFSAIAAVLTGRIAAGILTFGTLGIFVSLLVYKQFKDIEYYFYLNGGLSKKTIVLKLIAINFVLALILKLLI
jgi:hypothetical protein